MSSELTKTSCSLHFTYGDFIQAGATQRDLALPNIPKAAQTIEYIGKFSEEILERILLEFGRPIISFGFCSSHLANEIKKRPSPHIAPELDQHAGFELNTRGKRICQRDGFAVDFFVQGVPSSQLVDWIEKSANYDRIYFYGDDRPLHVSIAPSPVRQVIDMRPINGRRVPKRITDTQQLTRPK